MGKKSVAGPRVAAHAGGRRGDCAAWRRPGAAAVNDYALTEEDEELRGRDVDGLAAQAGTWRPGYPAPTTRAQCEAQLKPEQKPTRSLRGVQDQGGGRPMPTPGIADGHEVEEHEAEIDALIAQDEERRTPSARSARPPPPPPPPRRGAGRRAPAASAHRAGAARRGGRGGGDREKPPPAAKPSSSATTPPADEPPATDTDQPASTQDQFAPAVRRRTPFARRQRLHHGRAGHRQDASR